MTKFNPEEFESLWAQVEDEISVGYNVGRDRKSLHKGRYVLFMMLATVKRAGHWDFMARIFGLKGPTFELMIMQFITIISRVILARFVHSA